MKDTSSFYEAYWKQREADGRLHSVKTGSIPLRIKIAASMVQKRENDSELCILDIACGEGAFGGILRETLHGNFNLYGMDIAENALRHARQFYDTTMQLNVEQVDFHEHLKDARFDYIICLEVLEHLFDPTVVLKRLKPFLKENGYLITSFPNIAWWRYRLDLLKGEFPRGYTLFGPEEHIQNFTLKAFQSLLKAAGYEIVETKAHYHYPKSLRYFRRFLDKYISLFGYQIVVKAGHSVGNGD